MACINALEQDTMKDQWVGTSLKTGETRVFNTLDDYKQYVKNLEAQGTYCANVDPMYHATPYRRPDLMPCRPRGREWNPPTQPSHRDCIHWTLLKRRDRTCVLRAVFHLLQLLLQRLLQPRIVLFNR